MRYGRLFEVDVLHDYHLNLGSRVHEALNDAPRAQLRRSSTSSSFLRVQPTDATRRTLGGHQLLFKTTATGFKIGARLDDDTPAAIPMLPPDADFRLSFALTLADPTFLNFTALAGSSAAFYLFSNDTANEAAGGRFLSLPVPPFSAGRGYEAGEVRAEPSGGVINLFQASRDTGPSALPLAADWRRIPSDTHDPATTYSEGAIVLSANRLFRALVNGPGANLTIGAQWQPLGSLANQYVTREDARRLQATLFDLDVEAASVSQLTLQLVDSTASPPVWERTYTAESGLLSRVQVDLHHVRPGAYELRAFDSTMTPIAALTEPVYVDSDAVREGWFGVIEIGLGGGDLALLDGGGALRSPLYTLRFLNRPTRWRYIFPAEQAIGSGAEVAPDATNSRVLVTPTPRPLTRFGDGVRLQDTTPVLLPEPDVQRIRRQAGEWFSEIHTSNLPI